MKKTYFNSIVAIFALSLMALPCMVDAQGMLFPGTGTPGSTPPPLVPLQNTTPAPGAAANPAAPGSTQSANYLIKNPIPGTTSLSQVLLNVVNIVQILLIMAAVLYILYAGFMFVTARGAPAKIQKARDALLWGCVGIALILAAQVIITTLKNTVSGILQ
ncbi:MAG: hypothetical protein RJB39_416 [Candidatus Parcubacteria bacterium]|jgi:hypothetical protein